MAIMSRSRTLPDAICQLHQVTCTWCSFRWRERPIAVVALTARGMSSGSQSMGRGEPSVGRSVLNAPAHQTARGESDGDTVFPNLPRSVTDVLLFLPTASPATIR